MNFIKKFTASVLLLFFFSPLVYGLGSEVIGGGGSGAPSDAKFITQTADPTLSAEQALSALGTGLVKNTTGTGVLSIGVAGTDYVTGDSTNTFTNKTFDANGTGNSLSNIETADVASGSKTGADADLVTGTAGSNGNIASWNTDGDLVDSNLTAADFGKKDQGIMVLSPSESCATGDGAGDVAFRVPATINGWNLVGVGFGTTTAGTTGNFDIQIRNATQSADMLTTKMRVETGETDTVTSAQPGTIDTGNDDVATGDKIYFDIDSCQTTPALGALVSLTFQRP